MSKKLDYTYSVGKRKSASARVRLFKGKGESTVNSLPIEKYFTNPTDRAFWIKPFELTGAADKYYVSVNVKGGGKKSQLEAVIHGIARGLAIESREEHRRPLKKAGFLTRDARVRQRRNVGTGGKSRRAKQSPKR